MMGNAGNTSEISRERLAILEDIRAEFVSARMPGEDEIACEDDWEYEDIFEDFLGARRRTPSARFLERHAKSVFALKPIAYHYFIRFYLEYSVENTDSEVTDTLVFQMSSASEPPDDYWKPRLSRFSDTQRAVVCRYLRFTRKVIDADGVRSPVSPETFRRTIDFWCASDA